MFGRGKILKIDLTTGRISSEAIPDSLCRQYIGGEGINTRLLWEHFLKVNPRIDATSPDNILIWGVGPLGGTAYGAGTKCRWTYKGPAYGLFADSTSGGAFVSEMRWAGYDHMVITGKAKHLVYIRIKNDTVEIRDASHLRGMLVSETDAAIKKELGDREVETACIGPAGENLVRHASITVSCERAAGRTGPGCVFGSKNLKAIAVRGTKGIKVFDSKAFFRDLDVQMAALYKNRETKDYFKKFGTSRNIAPFSVMGWHSFRNAQRGQLPDDAVEKLGHMWYLEHMARRPVACGPGCNAPCQSWYRLTGCESPYAADYAGEYGMRPEYGAIIPFGGACDIRDYPAVSHLVKMCNEYSLDTFEAGNSVSFLMELWQRGIIDAADTAKWMGEPLSLEWGDHKAVDRVLTSIALQNNEMGRILQGGVYRAAQKIGELKKTPVMKYANYGKGGSPHCESIRSRPSLAMCAAVSNIGAHHLQGSGVDEGTSRAYFGRPDGGEALKSDLKGKSQALSEYRCAWRNSLGTCMFSGGGYRDFLTFPAEMFVDALYSVTGTKITADELWTAGKRVTNLAKAFNSRLGLRRKDDNLCERWLHEPMPDGTAKGMKAGDWLEHEKDEYYAYHGWDVATGLQKKAGLKELGLQDVAEVLEREKAIV